MVLKQKFKIGKTHAFTILGYTEIIMKKSIIDFIFNKRLKVQTESRVLNTQMDTYENMCQIYTAKKNRHFWFPSTFASINFWSSTRFEPTDTRFLATVTPEVTTRPKGGTKLYNL